MQVIGNKGAQPTQFVDPILAYCWARVATVVQDWINNIGSASRIFKIVQILYNRRDAPRGGQLFAQQ